MSMQKRALPLLVWKGLFPSLLKRVVKQGGALAAPLPSSELGVSSCTLGILLLMNRV